MTIYIPEKIKVGYQKRSDTYTGSLAYVIYYRKNKLCKESSWTTWRDLKIEPDDFTNEPLSGFVLNKKVGDYVSDWNHRKAYVRVYDPRNFEFEITIENLLYILENADSIKGKGLNGEFVYGWDGKDLILLPVDSPDYVGISGFSSLLDKPEKIPAKDLVLGGTYLTNKKEQVIYLGRFMRYNEYSWREDRGKPEGLHHYFYIGGAFLTMKSISGRIIQTVSTEPSPEYADIMDKLEKRPMYSPIDDSRTKYIPLTLEEFLGSFEDHYLWGNNFLVDYANTVTLVRLQRYGNSLEGKNYWFFYASRGWMYQETLESTLYDQTHDKKLTKEDLFSRYTFVKKEIYLTNGKLYRTEGVQNVH